MVDCWSGSVRMRPRSFQSIWSEGTLFFEWRVPKIKCTPDTTPKCYDPFCRGRRKGHLTLQGPKLFCQAVLTGGEVGACFEPWES